MRNQQADLQLRLELLRTRAALERAEVAAVIVELRTRTQRASVWTAAASSVGAAVGAGTGGWINLVFNALRHRSEWGTLALGALRSMRHHGVLTATAVGVGALVAVLARRKKRRNETPPEGNTTG